MQGKTRNSLGRCSRTTSNISIDSQPDIQALYKYKVELLKFPYPFEAAVTVASDADNASFNRFNAIHSLFCGNNVIRPQTLEWQILGLTYNSAWYSTADRGVRSLGLDFADSFFLFSDAVSMGMFRETISGRFCEDESNGHNTAEAIQGWLKAGKIDSFHSFLHYPRDRILPVLESFYRWCELENVTKPSVWTNHSLGVTPTGMCPRKFRKNRAMRIIRQIASVSFGPLFGRRRRPIGQGLVWYAGATPGSRYYINDILAANNLRYVWLNVDDLFVNRISLPEQSYNGRKSILEIVTMDDGIKYYRFPRCYAVTESRRDVGMCLRQSVDTCDTSRLFTRENLDKLCKEKGTCILYTHWTLARSFPIADETIGHFDLLRQYRDAGRLWVLPLAKLLEWTRIRTFLKYEVRVEVQRAVVDIQGVEDPVFGVSPISIADLRGLSFRVSPEVKHVTLIIGGRPLSNSQYVYNDGVCRIQ